MVLFCLISSLCPQHIVRKKIKHTEKLKEFYRELYTCHQDSNINILPYLPYSLFVHLLTQAHILLSFFCWMHFKVHLLRDFEISSISASIFYPLIWTYDTDTSIKSVLCPCRLLFFVGGAQAGRSAWNVFTSFCKVPALHVCLQSSPKSSSPPVI